MRTFSIWTYLLICGAKEAKDKTVAVRRLGSEKQEIRSSCKNCRYPIKNSDAISSFKIKFNKSRSSK